MREAGRAVRLAGSLTDITESKRLEGQIAFDAMHDRLTGQPNRDLFGDRLDPWLPATSEPMSEAGDQFQLHDQGFVRLVDREVIGFQALIRWQHPERGRVMPGDFIPPAEQSARINAIGRWTLFEAARQLVAWDGLGLRGEVAVNRSGRQFTESDLEVGAQQVLALLGGVEPHRYKLEVTEGMAMENPFRTTKVLNRLAEMGFKMSIDDFGTGYSSLA